MHKNMAALAECENYFIKLRILSARDPEVLEGYRRAWPQYFTEQEIVSIPLSRIGSDAMELCRINNDDPERVHKYWAEAAEKLSIPRIEVLFPWDPQYKDYGIPATRGLQFQCGDFTDIRNGSVVRLYHTKWVVVGFAGPRAGGWLALAPLACIDLDK